MNELFTRWSMQSPSFFKKFATFGKWIAAVGGVLMASTVAAPETIAENIIHTLKTVSTYMIFGGGIIVGVASATVSDPEELERKMNESKNEK